MPLLHRESLISHLNFKSSGFGFLVCAIHTVSLLTYMTPLRKSHFFQFLIEARKNLIESLFLKKCRSQSQSTNSFLRKLNFHSEMDPGP